VTLDPERRSVNRMIQNYFQGARSRGVAWCLDYELVRGLIFSPCHWCGADPEVPKRKLGYKRKTLHIPLPVNGIDRLDNDQGYVPGNCVPCCKECNGMKSTRSAETFIAKCVAVAKRHASTLKTSAWAGPAA
jgi:hypothetical protein